MLTARQVAELLGLSLSKVYDLAHRGALVSYRFDGAMRFDPADVERYKAQCRVIVAPPAPARLRTTLTLRVRDPSGESDLEKAFRKLGIKPRVTRRRDI